MPEPARHPDDIAVMERRRVARTCVSIPGRYALASRRNAWGERREFACRTVDISPEDIALVGPVSGPVGERVIAHFDELGQLDGRIVRLTESGFVIRLVATEQRRAWLAAKIDWLDKRKHHNLPDDRRHKRTIPKQPHTTVLRADGSVQGCFVIDMSVSGAGVSADFVPRPGEVLAIGKVIGRVVRIFAEGFAVRFITLQNAETLEYRLMRS